MDTGAIETTCEKLFTNNENNNIVLWKENAELLLKIAWKYWNLHITHACIQLHT